MILVSSPVPIGLWIFALGLGLGFGLGELDLGLGLDNDGVGCFNCSYGKEVQIRAGQGSPLSLRSGTHDVEVNISGGPIQG